MAAGVIPARRSTKTCRISRTVPMLLKGLSPSKHLMEHPSCRGYLSDKHKHAMLYTNRTDLNVLPRSLPLPSTLHCIAASNSHREASHDQDLYALTLHKPRYVR